MNGKEMCPCSLWLTLWMVYYKVKEKKKKYKGKKREGGAHRVFSWEQQWPSFTVLAGGALKPGAGWMCLRDPPLDTPQILREITKGRKTT